MVERFRVVSGGPTANTTGIHQRSGDKRCCSRTRSSSSRALRRRAVWSDLRKGVILAAIGVGLNFWSMLDDGTANGFGLILLFLGLGYCVLWFFEDRNTEPRGTP